KASAAQDGAAQKLQDLHEALAGYAPLGQRNGLAGILGGAGARAESPRGLYIHGPVGTGKSMLMDIFFETAPVEAKRRVHFHAFMQEVHERLHTWRQETRGKSADPLPRLAEAMAEEAWLLCFDEFHVTNIADAMILGRLFTTLFERGVVVVATSNAAPDRLYEGGLQRENFLPFIDLLHEYLEIVELGGVDYRRQGGDALAVYHTPLNRAAAKALDQAFSKFTDGAKGEPVVLKVKGRNVTLPLAANGVVRAGFADVCGRALGAADYQAIARRFHTVILGEVPVMPPARRNEARRFMTLIDTLYEHRVNLVISAAAVPDALYPEGHGAEEFRRTASRLIEMQSRVYIQEPHSRRAVRRGLARAPNSE
ncbi:MAG: cell division protein ZapE, partial [Alphaproteobacteria bacterium]